jgi:hypothetical protein
MAVIGTLWFTSSATAVLGLRLTVIVPPPPVILPAPPQPVRDDAYRKIRSESNFFMFTTLLKIATYKYG